MKLKAIEWQQLLKRIRENDPTGIELNLIDKEIGDQQIKDLVEALKTNSNLIYLNLRENKIGRVGSQALAELLKNTYSLVKLNLNSNLIDDFCMHELSEALKVNRKLISLDIGSNKITEAGASDLVDALKINQTITTCILRTYNLFLMFGNTNAVSPATQKQIYELLARNQFLKGQLYLAIQKGDLRRVESLLQQGVSILSVIDEGENKGCTPLHWAVIKNQIEVARYLIQQMRSQSVLLTLENAQGKTAEQLAMKTDLRSLFSSISSSITPETIHPVPSAPDSASTSTSTSSTVLDLEVAVSVSPTNATSRSFTDEKVQQYLEKISQGSEVSRKELISYFSNKRATAKKTLERHQKLAFDYFSQAEQQNPNKHQQSFLGKCYFEGYGVDRDYQEAFKWSSKAAEQNDVDAQFITGVLYEKGEGVKQSYLEAANNFRKAAEHNHPDAECCLGVLYLTNKIEKKADIKIGYQLLCSAAEKNNVIAQLCLGIFNWEGILASNSLVTKGFAGHMRASLDRYISHIHDFNDAVEKKDRLKRFYSYMRIRNLQKTQFETLGSQWDSSGPIQWLRKVAEKNELIAQLLLADIYEDKKEYKNAYEWNLKAAEQHDATAQYQVGIALQMGKGVKRDYKEALKWFRKAASQDESKVHREIGNMYEDGLGDVGNALREIGFIYERGLDVEQSYTKALECYTKAAKGWNSEAQFKLSNLYAKGLGVVKNIPRAIYWSLLASDRKNNDAIEYLKLMEKQGYGKIITEQQQIIAVETKERERAEEENKREKERSQSSQQKQTEGKSSQSTESSTAAVTLAMVPTSTITPVTGIQVSLSVDPTQLKPHRHLGEGAYGKVYFGFWNEHTEVAIKELKVSGLPDTVKEDFRNEAQVMANLRSPRIVQLYGVCFESPLRLVMEYLPKGSLFDVLHSRENIEWPQRIRIALDTGEGLHFLHVQNPVILHRDLKSLNVLLDVNFRAKLTDFGLAQTKQIINSTTKQQSNQPKSVGTIAWMAPELFTRKPEYSTASDVYAFGIVLWEMATRKIPFQDAADPSLIPMWVAQGDREDIPAETPVKYAALIKRCWDGRLDQRPTVNQIISELKTLESNTSGSDSNSSSSNGNTTSATSSTSSGPIYDSTTASTSSGPQYDAGVLSQLRQ